VAAPLRSSGVDLSTIPLFQPSSASAPNFILLATGRHASDLIVGHPTLLLNAAETVFIHPTVPPPNQLPDNLTAKIRVLLPMIDLSGFQNLWKERARESNWSVESSGALNEDLRANWPEALRLK
jgi:hypothetical protein